MAFLVHPGDILLHQTLPAHAMTQTELAADLGISTGYLGDLLHRRRRMTTRLALGLARVFGTSPQFWLNLQTNYDIALAEKEGRLERVRNPRR